MPTDLKISQLTAGNPALSGDLIPIDRSGSNFSITAGSIAALVTPLLTSGFLGNLHGMVCNPDSTLFSGLGCTPAGMIGTVANSGATASEGPALQITSQAIGSGQGTIYNNNNGGLTIGALKYWQTRAKLGGNGAGILWYAGMSDVNAGVALMPTTPTTQKVCAFRWVSGDANFSCVVCGGGGTATIVDSGIPVDTAYHTFQIFPTAGGTPVVFKIDGVTVATISTHLPTATDSMGTQVTIQANAVAHSIQYIWWTF